MLLGGFCDNLKIMYKEYSLMAIFLDFFIYFYNPKQKFQGFIYFLIYNKKRTFEKCCYYYYYYYYYYYHY